MTVKTGGKPMIRGLYIAATNMLTNTKELEAISNNMANVSSVGYKRDELYTESFNDVLMQKNNGSRYIKEIGTGLVEVQQSGDFYEAKTENGYFQISTDSGTSNNKEVKFTVLDGYLSTYYLNSDRKINQSMGDRLLGQNGPIFVGEEAFEIDGSGNVIVGGTTVDSLITGVSRDIIGTMNGGVKTQRLLTIYDQGSLQRTDQPMDFALQGDGYFELETEYGTTYTRNGQFSIDNEGYLVNTTGNYVQGLNGRLQLNTSDIIVNKFGEISVDGEVVDKIKVTNFSDKGDLYKVGGAYFRLYDTMQGEEIDYEGSVHQGFVESSNSSSIEEMIKMINVSRNYESGQKVIAAIDNLIGKAVNEVGKVG